MTFEPVLPWWLFFTLAGLTLVLRMYTLYRVLVVVGKGSHRKVVLRWCSLTLVIVCLFAAGLRPGIEEDRHVVSQAAESVAANNNVNVFFVVDRSLNSRAEDYGNNQFRMAGIRADMTAIVDQYPTGRFGITSFATKAREDWPLSDDVWSLRALLKGYSAYDSEFDSLSQVNVGAADDQLKRQLELAAKQYPGSRNLVFYFGAGAGISKQDATKFDIPAALVAGGAVLGYGTPAGGAIASRLAGNGQVSYFPDPNGAGGPFLSVPDEASLRAVAEQLHVPYFHRALGDSTSTMIPSLDGKAPTATQQKLSVPGNRTEFYWVFTAIAMLLMYYELYAMAREYRASRMTTVRSR